ncbi:MAG TPA: hypothetical protein VG916_04865, partial [Gemmatimonadaceae bacterium]|nr:hypothetical protein [Gemmatimonadaceae bacterium]
KGKKAAALAKFRQVKVAGGDYRGVNELIAQIEREVAGMERDARAAAANGVTTFEHTFFGRLAIADYVMFNALHFDHHREQLP